MLLCICTGSSPEEEMRLSFTNHTFIIPKKEINMFTDMAKWKRSQVLDCLEFPAVWS